jgi:L-ascorbate metabolism protein UlaG (beta-lactamase superfamily)
MFHAANAGPRRTSPPAAEVEDLKIDVCLLSHTHYDHLDIPSALRIGNRALWFVSAEKHNCNSFCFCCDCFIEENSCTFFELSACTLNHFNFRFLNFERVVPVGVRSLMREIGITNCVELNWWDRHSVRTPSGRRVEVIFTPTKHWTGRTLFDRNAAMWGSFAVMGPRQRFFFSGDTAYCDVFKTIGKHFGPFDMSAIAIGAYKPR